MATTIWIVADLVPLVTLAVFVVAFAADPVARLRHRLESAPRREPGRVHESRA